MFQIRPRILIYPREDHIANKNLTELADEWKAARNSRDLDRIVALYREDVVFKSPRVSSVSGEASGVLSGKTAVRASWTKILERRPDLECTVGARLRWRR